MILGGGQGGTKWEMGFLRIQDCGTGIGSQRETAGGWEKKRGLWHPCGFKTW